MAAEVPGPRDWGRPVVQLLEEGASCRGCGMLLWHSHVEVTDVGTGESRSTVVAACPRCDAVSGMRG